MGAELYQITSGSIAGSQLSIFSGIHKNLHKKLLYLYTTTNIIIKLSNESQLVYKNYELQLYLLFLVRKLKRYNNIYKHLN